MRKGCYERTVHGIDFVLYQRSDPETPVDCSSDMPCICWKSSGQAAGNGDNLLERELADIAHTPVTEGSWRYLAIFGAGAFLGAWHFTKARDDKETLPLLDHV